MDPLSIIAAIDAAVRIGGQLGQSLLTLIEGHRDTPDAQRQKATAARERLAQSSAEIDDARAQAKARIEGEVNRS